MPRTATSDAPKKGFRAGLSPDQQVTFDELEALLNHEQQGLEWYHKVGKRVTTLKGGGGKKRLADLANALGRKPDRLRKTIRLAKRYPESTDLHRLERMGVTWTNLCATFPIKKKSQRHRILTQAAKQRWSNAKLKAEVQRLVGSKRIGIGGRPRKAETYDPEAGLHRLVQESRAWLRAYDHVWTKTSQSDWRILLKRGDAPKREEVRGVIDKMRSRLERMAQACDRR